MFQEKMAGEGNDPDDLIVQAFKAYDNEGKIDSKMFEHALKTWGDKMTKAEIDDIFGEVENPQVQNVLALFNPVQFMQAPNSHKAMKFVEAARYGGSRRSVAKFEHRYTCSLGMDVLQDLF